MGDPRNGSTNGNGAPNGNGRAVVEYYILCPQRATDVPGLITHLISRDICERRQGEHYHKCPTCIRSRAWRQMQGLAAEESVASVAAPADAGRAG